MTLLTLAEAAQRLGLSAVTLRAQVKHARLAARLYGKTYLVEEAEVERYRAESLGRVGRPRGMAQGFQALAFKAHLTGEPGPCQACEPFRDRLLSSTDPAAPDLPIAGCISDRGCTCRYE